MLQDDSSNPKPEPGSVRRPMMGSPKYSEYSQQPKTLTEEEIEFYKSCTRQSFLKTGLPFAIFCELYKMFVNKTQGASQTAEANAPVVKSPNIRRGIMFVGNVIAGSILYAPTCFRKLRDFHNANEKKKTMLETRGPASLEETGGSTQPEDFSYPTDLMTNLSDSEDSFSADFTSTQLLTEEAVKPKIPHTTYEDLRAKNRKRQTESPVKPPPPVESPPRPPPPPEPILSDPPPRRVKRNKYGDEME